MHPRVDAGDDAGYALSHGNLGELHRRKRSWLRWRRWRRWSGYRRGEIASGQPRNPSRALIAGRHEHAEGNESSDRFRHRAPPIQAAVYRAAAGTGPSATDRRKNGSQKSHSRSRTRFASRRGQSRTMYLVGPVSTPGGVLELRPMDDTRFVCVWVSDSGKPRPVTR